MKYYVENNVRFFNFWSGAVETAHTIEKLDRMTGNAWDCVEWMLSEIFDTIPSETAINDLFWFDSDFIAEFLGYEDWEAVENAVESAEKVEK